MYEYKTVPVPSHLATQEGRDLAQELANYIQNIINNMAKDGWEFYRADNFSISETLGCLSSLFGVKPNMENYNILTFRKQK